MGDRQRIAVLGGGIGSLAAVYGLTHEPDWQKRYDITVYQLGWRLGGKGATGRDPALAQRVQEHGIHVWFGFYENAFAMARRIYEELGRPREAPLSSWRDAFVPHEFFAMEQEFRGEHHSWSVRVPTNDSLPGDGRAFPSVADLLGEAFQLLVEIWRYAHREPVKATPVHEGLLSRLEEWIRGGWESLEDKLPVFADARAGLDLAVGLVGRFAADVVDSGPVRRALVHVLRGVLARAREELGKRIETDLLAYRGWISLEFVAVNLIGVLRDELLSKGFDTINHWDYQDWLADLGMSETTLRSSLVQSAFDSSFAFVRSKDDPEMEAGVAVRGGMRMLLLYKGAVLYRFAAGTGDTVFAPLYEVLRRRGVRFEFFHEVTEIVASPTGQPPAIDAIELRVQADLTVGAYDPLVDVKGLPCWPSEPRYAQLVQGAQLREEGVDLESRWSGWSGVRTETLRRGADFDLVVCGIPVGALGDLTATLRARSDSWARMLDALKTTRTQAFQLATTLTSRELGYPGSERPILSTFGEPLDTWCDYTVATDFENWPPAKAPAGLHFFCGAMTEGAIGVAPPGDVGYPATQHAIVRQQAFDWIHAKLPDLWPNAFEIDPATGERRFRWEILVDPQEREGEARLEAQWIRANIEPSERYVLSVPRSSRARLRSDASGFQNLYLAGDWTDNGINAGCMEAATISGLQVSRAIGGWPRVIPGEKDGLIGI